MRILVASTRGTGHFRPLLPFVLAARDAGHDVLVAGPPPLRSTTQRHGLAHHTISLAPPERYADVNELIRAADSFDETMVLAMRELFVGSHARAALPGMLRLVEGWQPDLVLRETCEFASLIAAQAYRVPDARVAISLSTPNEDMFLRLGAEPLNALRAEFSLFPDQDAARALASPVLTQSPARLDGNGSAPGRTLRYRTPVDVDATPLPDWWNGSDDPLVPISFGTVAPTEGAYPALYRTVIDALADLPIRMLVTVGVHADPAELGVVPPSVHVERWVPQAQVMPHTAAMIHHGGAGTTLAALAAGVPSVVVPLFADQPLNALSVEALGAGFALTGGEQELVRIPEALAVVLEDPRYGAAAEHVAGQIRALPPVADAVGELEALAVGSLRAAA